MVESINNQLLSKLGRIAVVYCCYHYCATSFNDDWTQVLRMFSSCLRHVGDLRWWGSLTFCYRSWTVHIIGQILPRLWFLNMLLFIILWSKLLLIFNFNNIVFTDKFSYCQFHKLVFIWSVFFSCKQDFFYFLGRDGLLSEQWLIKYHISVSHVEIGIVIFLKIQAKKVITLFIPLQPPLESWKKILNLSNPPPPFPLWATPLKILENLTPPPWNVPSPKKTKAHFLRKDFISSIK